MRDRRIAARDRRERVRRAPSCGGQDGGAAGRSLRGARRVRRPRRQRRRRLLPSVQVRAMSTSDAPAELAVSRGGGASRAVQGSDDGNDWREPHRHTVWAHAGPTVTFATTEHFNLQTARSLTVSEANGRASIYLAALSGSLIALAFVGQMSRLGAAFYALALILLPVLALMCFVRFLRRVHSSIEDIAGCSACRRGTRSGSPRGGEREQVASRRPRSSFSRS